MRVVISGRVLGEYCAPPQHNGGRTLLAVGNVVTEAAGIYGHIVDHPPDLGESASSGLRWVQNGSILFAVDHRAETVRVDAVTTVRRRFFSASRPSSAGMLTVPAKCATATPPAGRASVHRALWRRSDRANSAALRWSSGSCGYAVVDPLSGPVERSRCYNRSEQSLSMSQNRPFVTEADP